MIAFDHVSKRYGALNALQDISFSVPKGQVLGLLGQNGAGKTTAMNILTGCLAPSSGSVAIGGKDVLLQPREAKRMIGYLPEAAPVYDEMTVRAYLRFACELKEVEKKAMNGHVEAVAEKTGLSDVLDRKIGNLSKGYRQRTGLAQAIIHSPDILILDEPTTGLDPNQIIEIRKLICDIGREKTVILSTHILQEVEAVCNRVLILNHGKIVAQGTPDSIREQVQKDDRFTIEVAGSVDAQSLKALEPVSDILSTEALDGKTVIKISAQKGTDAGALIFDWAVKNGYRLSALVPEQTSLEDIFRKLTNQTGV